MLTRTCGQESAASCIQLGDLYFEGKLVPRELPTAARFLQSACDQASRPACYKLGRMYKSGTGVAQDRAKAEALYDRACEHSEGRPGEWQCQAVERECEVDAPRNCYRVALESYSFDRPRAAALYERACEAGIAEACRLAGIIHATGDTRLPRDEKLARRLYKRACDLDSKEGCAATLQHDETECLRAPLDASQLESCWQAGLGYEKKMRLERDNGGSLYGAKRSFARACKLDPEHEACAALGRLCSTSVRPDICREDASRF